MCVYFTSLVFNILSAYSYWKYSVFVTSVHEVVEMVRRLEVSVAHFVIDVSSARDQRQENPVSNRLVLIGEPDSGERLV